jgi:hypothetical protein
VVQGITLLKLLIGMKTLHFRNTEVRHRFLCLIAISALLCCCGCKPVTSADISGAYSRQGNGITDTLILSNNGTFQQTITYTNGNQWLKSGTWVFKSQVIELSQFDSSFDFEHKAITIPPLVFSPQPLWVEKGTLIRNEYEPKWLKRE